MSGQSATTSAYTNNQSATTSIYTNSQYGVSLQHPNSWGVTEGIAGSVVSFINSNNSSFKSNVNLVVQNLSSYGGAVTLQVYVQISLDQLNSTIGNLEITNQQYTTFNGYKAYEIQYTGTFSKVPLCWSQIMFIVGDKAYLLTYTSSPENYNDDMDTANNIMDSLTI